MVIALIFVQYRNQKISKNIFSKIPDCHMSSFKMYTRSTRALHEKYFFFEYAIGMEVVTRVVVSEDTA